MIIFLNLKQKKGNRQRGMCYITINQMIMKTFVFILFFLSLASLSPTSAFLPNFAIIRLKTAYRVMLYNVCCRTGQDISGVALQTV